MNKMKSTTVMTREEAIKILQHLVEIVSSEDYQETFKMAISALRPVSREQVEQMRAELEQARESLDFARTKDAEIVRLGTELEQVKAERNAAVEDVAAIIGNIEEIRQRYGVDYADTDDAFAELCGTYCANKGRSCYAEGEKYHCKNFKWRGMKED